MSKRSYEVPDPQQNPEAYLSYSVQDAPSVEYSDYLHSRGMHDSWWRRHFGPSESRYEAWKQTQLQDYKNYLDAYDINYNSEFARRARLEASGFSGQYLANGIGGSSSSSSPGLSSGIQQSFGSPHGESKGLNKVMQSLQLMSAAGIAMKNFGEGKAAMKFANDMGAARLYSEQQKGRGLFYDAGSKQQRYDLEFALQNDPSQYGYSRVNGTWKFTGANGVTGRNMRLEAFLQNLDSQEAQLLLRRQQQALNQLTYENRSKYEAATIEAQNAILQGKKSMQDIELEYAAKLKQMGLAAPIIKMGLESLKLFL